MNKLKLVLETPVKYRTKPSLRNSEDTYEQIKPMFEDVINYKERVVIICVNRANKIIGWNVLSDGGVHASIIDVKIVMQHALLTNSSAIILAHNHPSGTLKPSATDIKITDKVKAACKVMDIEILDHLIITDEGFFSFADEGMI